jgi:hypothetical protein
MRPGLAKQGRDFNKDGAIRMGQNKTRLIFVCEKQGVFLFSKRPS